MLKTLAKLMTGRRQPTLPEPDDLEHFLTHQDRRRRYVVHVPHGYNGARRLPVVLAFHGGGGRVNSIRLQSRLNDVADRFGFLVVYPEGTGFLNLLTFNAGICCGYAVRKKVDDVGFVRKLIDDDLPGRYLVDSQRIYATGLSNGAMLCYRLACELSDRIAAIAPVAGGMGVDGPIPGRPVPIMHFHGMKDRNVPFLGGVGPNAMQPIAHRPIREVLAWWAWVNHCREKAVEVQRKTDYVLERFEPALGQAGAPVVLVGLPEGGHNWPGGVDTTAQFGTGDLVASVDASTLMWQFFAQHSLASRGT